MTLDNNQPLYKVLNRQRTHGKMVASLYALTDNCLRIDSMTGKVLFEVIKANANDDLQSNADTIYAALAINNLANVADKLDRLTKWVTLNTDAMPIELIEAKEALKAIS